MAARPERARDRAARPDGRRRLERETKTATSRLLF